MNFTKVPLSCSSSQPRCIARLSPAEIIGGLKKQGFLIAQGKNIVPTETGLSLFGVLKQADPALVDPGVTAQLE